MSFVVYRSSAGSGKTFTLVKEYLKMVLKRPGEFRHILAITFTNKAANEMKERILDNLKQLSVLESGAPSQAIMHLLPDLRQVTGLDNAGISQRAAETLKLILHNYSDFAITTIDSFVHRIIRTFAHDLHLPLNFEVELDMDKLIAQSVDLLISRVGSNEQLTKILVRFLETKTENEKSWHIEKDLQEFAKSLMNEDGTIFIERLRNLSLDDFMEINNRVNALIAQFENTVHKIGTEAFQLIQNQNISINSFFHGTNGIGKYFENISKRNFDKLLPNSYVASTINDDKWYTAKLDLTDKIAIDSIKPQLVALFQQIENFKKDRYNEYLLLKLLTKNIYPIAVLNELDKELNEIKTRNNILPISEFNKRIAEIVRNEPVPFIYERLGEKYHHFLIDEFQDTSVLQWQNLLPLIANSLSYNRFNMIVGDGKQAIYRFRSGEVEQFAQLPYIYKNDGNPVNIERELSLVRNYKAENLNKNFRSKAEIITFNNEFFRCIASNLPPDYQSIYEGLEQEYDPENTGGLVSIEFLDKKNSESSFEEQNFSKINQIIAQAVNDGFEWKDIAILCRSNAKASNIAQYLIEQGIDIISSQSLLLACSPEVNFMISCLQYLNNPVDAISQRAMKQYLVNTGRIPAEAINKPLKTLTFDFHVSALIKLPLYDLCEKIIRIFTLNNSVNPHIQFFLDAVLEFSMANRQNLSDFLLWWEEKKKTKSIIVPEGINAVRIMTIHKAKGLEFPVVIYPYAEEKVSLTKKSQWVDFDNPNIPMLRAALLPITKDLATTTLAPLYEEEKGKSLLDLINILYVVLTRASNRLYVLTSFPANEAKEINSIPLFFQQFLKSSGIWSENKTTYIFGKAVAFLSGKRSSLSGNYHLTSFISNEWHSKVLISQQAVEAWDVENPDKNREWGILLHTCLAKIKTADDIDSVLNDYYLQGILDDDERSRLNENIRQVITHPMLAGYFTHEVTVKTEADILDANGMLYRPDRLILNGNKAVIIDYKTGKPAEKHRKQLRNYSCLLADLGYTSPKMLLVYLDKTITIDEFE